MNSNTIKNQSERKNGKIKNEKIKNERIKERKNKKCETIGRQKLEKARKNEKKK